MKKFAKFYPCGLAVALLSLQLSIMPTPAADHQTIGFDELFVLSEDREDALKQLVPGTEDYYYYHSLHHQNTGEFGEVEKLLKPWIKRYNTTERVREIQHRQALMQFDANSKATLDYLKKELGLGFNHSKEELNQKPNYATALDPKRIARDALLKEAFRRAKNLGGVSDSALDWLLREEVVLDPTRRRDLLQRLKLPDFPNLVALIATELKTKESRGFGEFEIHRQLTREQLDELVGLAPKLARETNFVNAYLTKLRPGADVDWTNDEEAKADYLKRLWAYVSGLDPAFSSLKANVLYRLLDQQRRSGNYDRNLFMTYLKIPRSGSYVEPKFLSRDGKRFSADLGADFREVAALSPIGADDALVRDFLMSFFTNDRDYSAYTPYVRESWLKPIFAEAKIVNGLGDQEKWYSMISPTQLKALKDRIDIDFSLTNPLNHGPADAVELDLFIKNVDQLLVKVYEINALNFYLLNQREVNTDIVLDGLVANSEKKYDYDEIDLRRVKRSFAFPELKGKSGTWVIEFIGNGRSSRALVRKGKLQYVASPSAVGSSVKVYDGANQLVEGASIWLAGREYKADDKGRVSVPFSNSGGRLPMILVAGEFASLEQFQQAQQSYQFSAGFHVERETLLPGREATVAVRPALAIAGQPINLGVLKNVRLSIVSTDQDGISSSVDVPQFELGLDRESLFDFKVPERLKSITFTLAAEVENFSQGKSEPLSASETFHLNAIDRSDQTVQFHLAKIDGEYFIEVLGKAAEVYPNRVVNLEVKHHDFKDAANVTLQSDAQGHIRLGELEGIDWVRVEASGNVRAWELPGDWHSRSRSVHGVAGEPLVVPYSGASEKVGRGEFALFEVRGGTFVNDRFGALALEDGFVKIGALPAGDYRLFLKESGVAVDVRLAAGEKSGRYVLAEHRHLEVKNSKPLQIGKIEVGEKEVKINVANAGELTRVHVAVTRYLPEFSFRDYLGAFPWSEPQVISRGHSSSRYLSGRDIGDELRYILDRRQGKVFPGNMLRRPSILLNPWAIRDTDTGIVDAQAGDDYRRTADNKASARGGTAREPGRRSRKQAGGEQEAGWTSLDFFALRSQVIYNLAPDKDGFVTLPIEDLIDRQHLHVFAVDPANSAYRQVSVSDRKTAVVSTALKDGLNPAKHYAEQRKVTLLGKGEKLTVDDLSTAKLETYDDLADVFGLYTTLSGNGTLGEFRFILDWPELKEEEKRATYSKFACHELNFFLSRRDPEFFDTVVKPYLANKKDKTFLDHYLTGADLKEYLEAWNYSRLNVVERILLAGRIGGDEPGATARHLNDLLELIPVDVAELTTFFNTAIAGKALGLSVEGRLSELLEEQEVLTRSDALDGALEMKVPTQDAFAAAPAVVAAPAREEARGLKKSLGRLASKHKAAKDATVRFVMDADGFEDTEKFGLESIKEIGEQLKKVRKFYRKLEATKEWAENNYYHLLIADQNAELVSPSAFWVDFAKHVDDGGESPFLSEHFIGAQRNFTEMMFAMSVIGLPYKSGDHGAEVDAGKLAIEAASPAIVIHKEINEAPISDEKTPLLISQNYFLQSDRYEKKNGEQIDKFIDGEFLAGAIYGSQVVATNPTSGKQKLDLLVQIPHGAVPVLNARKTHGQRMELAPYHTQTFEYFFYFPLPSEEGKTNAGFPAHLARNEKIAAWGDAREFDVVAKFSKLDTASWDYISQHGTSEQVVERLRTANTSALDLGRIAWRMKDVDFFRQVTRLLHTRHVYNQTLYSYGLYHGEVSAARQFLMHEPRIANAVGAYLKSPLLDIDPVARRSYQHLEYSPLVNARAHQLGRERKIVNPQLHSQYHNFLRVLRYKPQLGAEERLDLAYYLLLQDRIAEGLVQLEKAEVDKLPGSLQHDYFLCHAAFYNEDPAEARRIAKKYAKHPVDRWRERFAEVIAQADEITGKQVAEVNGENGATETHPDDGSKRDKEQDLLADTEPNIGVKVEAGKITVSHQNVDAALVNYYEMDLEFLFSSNPFVGSGGADRFSIIKPNLSTPIKLGGKKAKEFALPEEFRSTNVLVEVVAAGRKVSQAYYAHTLDVTLAENYGRLDVRDQKTGKPISKAYVKVYARDQDGSVKFYKDGYTDLRGKFDYASLNTSQLGTAQRFSILVMAGEGGSLVKEAAPPAQ